MRNNQHDGKRAAGQGVVHLQRALHLDRRPFTKAITERRALAGRRSFGQCTRWRQPVAATLTLAAARVDMTALPNQAAGPPEGAAPKRAADRRGDCALVSEGRTKAVAPPERKREGKKQAEETVAGQKRRTPAWRCICSSALSLTGDAIKEVWGEPKGVRSHQ